MTTLVPASLEELAEAVRSRRRVLAVGAGTKPRLSQVDSDVTRLSTAGLRGIVDYEPSEFTFTARAGTPLREIADTLARRRQYLPFDPLLLGGGATLGGTVAAGLSGPGRFRFGGVRDFILGVRFVDGEGRLLRLGGRVVKNAAGFDVPKFLVGSAGRFGVLAEMTFKVFPEPAVRLTLRLHAKDTPGLVRIMTDLAVARWEVEALEASPEEGVVWARLAGPAAALEVLADEILRRWPGERWDGPEAEAAWGRLAEFAWAHADGPLVKVALTPSQVAAFVSWARREPGVRVWIASGGNAGYLSFPPGVPVAPLDWPALTLRGDLALRPGRNRSYDIAARVKAALDPLNRFPGIDE